MKDVTMSSNSDGNSPLGSCDIVMKGGIVSGVVYPKAIATLSTRFYFKNIGGTSAGAIAAAAAAAAEYARLTRNTADSFEKLRQLPKILGTKVGRTTRLFNLFQPQSITAAPFRVMSMVLNANGGFWRTVRFVFATLICYWPFSLLGLVPGGILLGQRLCRRENLVAPVVAPENLKRSVKPERLPKLNRPPQKDQTTSPPRWR